MQYVKLGEKASMFYDPTTEVKVLPGQAVGVTNREKESKKFKRAIGAGHLERISKEEAEELNSSTTKANEKAAADVEADQSEEGRSLGKMSKSELVEKAMELDLGTEKELDDMSKRELKAIISDAE